VCKRVEVFGLAIRVVGVVECVDVEYDGVGVDNFRLFKCQGKKDCVVGWHVR